MKFFIDGSNLLLIDKGHKPWDGPGNSQWAAKKRFHKKLNKDITDYDPINPRMDVIETLVLRLLEFRYDFKLYFDTPALYQCKSADHRGEGKNFEARFLRLKKLGPDLVHCMTVGQADDLLLSDANGAWTGVGSVYIISNDKFAKAQDGHRERFPQLFSDKSKSGHATVLVSSQLSGSQSTGQNLVITIPGFDDQKSMCRMWVEEVDVTTRIPEALASQDESEQGRGSSGPKGSTVADEVDHSIQEESSSESSVGKSERDDRTDRLSPRRRETSLKHRPGMRVTPLKVREGEFSRDELFIRCDPAVVKLGKLGATAAHLGIAWPMYVGCDADCDLVVDSAQKFVSGKHLVIDRLADGTFSVTDRSKNGAFLGPARLEKNRATALPQDGGILSLVDASGTSEDAVDLVFEFAVGSSNMKPPVEPVSSIPIADKDQRESGSLAVLHLKLKSGKEIRQPIHSLPFEIGVEISGVGCNIPLVESFGVSRKHLIIRKSYRDMGFIVENHGSNITTLDSVAQAKKGSEFVWLFADSDGVGSGRVVMAADDSPEFQPVRAWISR
jgi:hypothetical protein